MAGFAFARLEWRGRDAVFLLYLATLMVPGIVTLLPNYVILKSLGWLDSFQALHHPGHVHGFWHLYDAPVYDRATQRTRRGR